MFSSQSHKWWRSWLSWEVQGKTGHLLLTPAPATAWLLWSYLLSLALTTGRQGVLLCVVASPQCSHWELCFPIDVNRADFQLCVPIPHTAASPSAVTVLDPGLHYVPSFVAMGGLIFMWQFYHFEANLWIDGKFGKFGKLIHRLSKMALCQEQGGPWPPFLIFTPIRWSRKSTSTWPGICQGSWKDWGQDANRKTLLFYSTLLLNPPPLPIGQKTFATLLKAQWIETTPG